jgi:hypothetical protein
MQIKFSHFEEDLPRFFEPKLNQEIAITVHCRICNENVKFRKSFLLLLHLARFDPPDFCKAFPL